MRISLSALCKSIGTDRLAARRFLIEDTTPEAEAPEAPEVPEAPESETEKPITNFEKPTTMKTTHLGMAALTSPFTAMIFTVLIPILMDYPLWVVLLYCN